VRRIDSVGRLFALIDPQDNDVLGTPIIVLVGYSVNAELRCAFRRFRPPFTRKVFWRSGRRRQPPKGQLAVVNFRPAFIQQRRDLTSEGLTKSTHRDGIGDAGPGRVVVVIAAHNEQALIGEALESLAAQTRIADGVIVITDRCTDETPQISVAHGATIWATIDNHDKKAGALDQVLGFLLPRLTDNDAVLMMDADTSLSPGFLSEATRRLREPEERGPRVGGVGGIFFGYPVKGFLAHIQNNEYVRYAR